MTRSKRRTGFIVGGVVLVVVLAVGGFAAWYLLADDAPPPPKLTDEASSRPGGTPDGAWRIRPGGYVGYRMDELFAGETLTKTAVGRTNGVSGSMTIAEDRITAAHVSADLQQLESDRTPRDTYLHDNALETNTYPTAEFDLTEPAKLPTPPPSGTVVDVPVTGTLALHGVKQPISTTLQGRWTGDRIDVVGSIPIQLRTYNINPPKTAVVTTEDDGDLELKLVFRRG